MANSEKLHIIVRWSPETKWFRVEGEQVWKSRATAEKDCPPEGFVLAAYNEHQALVGYMIETTDGEYLFKSGKKYAKTVYNRAPVPGEERTVADIPWLEPRKDGK